MSLENVIPEFLTFSDGTPRLDYTAAAKAVREKALRKRAVVPALPDNSVKSKALKELKRLKGNLADRTQVLGQYQMQFGAFQGRTFLWVVENALGYAAYVVSAIAANKEKRNSSALSMNKFALKEYVESFPSGRRAVQLKLDENKPRIDSTKQQQIGPQPPSSSSTAAQGSSLDDRLLYDATQALESAAASLSTGGRETSPLDIFPGWKESLSEHDCGWIAKKFFSTKNGKLRFKHEVVDRLWFSPPPPPSNPQQVPAIYLYFARPICMWMPRKVFKVSFVCPRGCKKELTSAGMYSKTRLVLSLDTYYNLAAEYLECTSCNKKWISWSDVILRQLNVFRRTLFPALLTYQYSCDWQVVEMMRDRSLGNSPTQLQRRLSEMHYKRWMQCSGLYLTDLAAFKKALSSSLALNVQACTPPGLTKTPSIYWLMSVHRKDVTQRLGEIKASITSVYGEILKIDSTKKVSEFFFLKSSIYHNDIFLLCSGHQEVSRRSSGNGQLGDQCRKRDWSGAFVRSYHRGRTVTSTHGQRFGGPLSQWRRTATPSAVHRPRLLRRKKRWCDSLPRMASTFSPP